MRSMHQGLCSNDYESQENGIQINQKHQIMDPFLQEIME